MPSNDLVYKKAYPITVQRRFFSLHIFGSGHPLLTDIYSVYIVLFTALLLMYSDELNALLSLFNTKEMFLSQ